MTRTSTSITRGITYAFGLLLLLYLSQTIISFYGLSALSGLTKTIHDHPLVVSNAALSADTSILKMQREMKEIVLFIEPADIAPVITQLEELEQATFTQLQIIADNILGDEGKRLAAKTRQLFADWKPIRDKAIGLVRQGDLQAAAGLTRNQGADHVAGLEMKMIELADYARKKADGLYSESRRVDSTIVNLTTAFFLTWLVLFAVIISVTLRRARAGERAIHEEREKLRITLLSIGDGVIATDKNGDLTMINQVAEHLTGWKEAEAIGQNIGKVFRIINETTRETCSNPVEKVLLSNTIVGLANHTVLLAKDGTERAIADSGSPIADQYGRVSGVVLVFRDQTEEREYQKKIERNEALLNASLHISRLGCWELDLAGHDLFWSEEMYRIHDIDKESILPGEDLLEKTWQCYAGEDRAKIIAAFQECFATGKAFEHECRFTTAKGRPLWVRATGQAMHKDNRLEKIIGTLQDVSAHRAAKERIEHLNLVLQNIRRINQLIIYEQDPGRLIHEGCRLLVENRGYACALIILTDASQHIVSWDRAGNAANTEAFNNLLDQGQLPPCCNCQQTEQTGIIPVNSDSALCQQCTLVEGHAASQSLCAILRHEETIFGYLVATRTSALSVDEEERSLFNDLARDLAYALNVFRTNKAHKESTEKLERQLLQAQKMESVGRLAGGVAHDYNNMLSVIIGFTELALEEIEPENTLHSYLSEVLLAAQRSSDITRQLLAFARKQTIAPTLLDLNQTVVSMLNMLHRLIGEDIDLVWIPGANLWPVKIDPAQVDQIMANLCVNARDAIVGTGKLTIETRNVQLSEDYCADHAGFYPGDYVMLAVSDDGCGMTRDTLDHIFEPFFTTKGIGQGTGLGMSTVYGIVKQNKGFINVYSELNNGTTVRIYFVKDTGTAAEMQAEALQDQLGHGETILLVEDEEAILRLGKRILGSLGYTVLEALSPAAAREIAENFPGNIELLITDVIMPGMNGRELAGRLKTIFPGLRVLYMSGYTANAIAHHGVLEEDVCFMQKPFSKVEMASKVRQALAGPC